MSVYVCEIVRVSLSLTLSQIDRVIQPNQMVPLVCFFWNRMRKEPVIMVAVTLRCNFVTTTMLQCWFVSCEIGLTVHMVQKMLLLLIA